MGWTALDTRLERIRGMVAEDPAGARDAIAGLLEDTSSPSGRVHLFALLSCACRRVGDFEAAARALLEGQEQPLRGRSRFAQGELAWCAAEFSLYRSEPDTGRRAADKAIHLLRPLAMVPEGKSKGAKRKGRIIRAEFASALITSSQVAYHLEGTPHRALADALEALRMADPRRAARVHLSAVSAVSTLVTKVGTLRDVLDVLELVGDADRLLSRRVPTRHPHRLKLAWIRALALARFGALEQADRMLEEVIEGLRELGLDADAERVVLDLLWVIGERAGRPDLARYLRRSYGLPADADPPPPPPDDPSPIGF